MDYVLGIGMLVLLGINIWLLLLLRRQDPGAQEKAVRDALRDMQEDDRKLRQELASDSDRNLRLSMQMIGDSLTQSQTQTRETTASQLRQFEERIQGLEAANARAMAAMRETLEGQLELLRSHNDKRLGEIRKTVDETLQTQLDARMTESFRRVTNSLEAVYRGLGEMKTLAADVGGLKRVLSNVKTRGNLGELQLGSILQEILAPEQYACNVETVPGSGKRVEFAVKLPTDDGRPVYLPIDSKFPADCYEQLLNAQDSGNRAEAEAAQNVLRQRILAFAKDIRDKYIHEPDTTAFGILFLPFEGLYSEVVGSGMVEELQRRYAVNVAGPSTMAAMLNALSMGFRTLAIQKQSDQVWEILGGVKAEFEKFEETLGMAKRKLDAAGKELDALIGVRTRAINRKLEQVQRLEIDTAADAEEMPE